MATAIVKFIAWHIGTAAARHTQRTHNIHSSYTLHTRTHTHTLAHTQLSHTDTFSLSFFVALTLNVNSLMRPQLVPALSLSPACSLTHSLSLCVCVGGRARQRPVACGYLSLD